FVIEDDGRHLHVEVALDEPFGVRRAEIIFEEQRLGLRVLFQTDDAVPVNAVLGIPTAIAGAGVHDAAFADGGTGSPPHTATRGAPRPDLLRREVVCVSNVGIAAAALRGVSIN